jgi:hypothetical protein
LSVFLLCFPSVKKSTRQPDQCIFIFTCPACNSLACVSGCVLICSPMIFPWLWKSCVCVCVCVKCVCKVCVLAVQPYRMPICNCEKLCLCVCKVCELVCVQVYTDSAVG